MALKIKIRPSYNQEFAVMLNKRECIISLYQRGGILFMDLRCDGADVVRGAVCHNDQNIVWEGADNFTGNLRFLDTLGADDPAGPELGTRYELYYLTPEEAATE